MLSSPMLAGGLSARQGSACVLHNSRWGALESAGFQQHRHPGGRREGLSIRNFQANAQEVDKPLTVRFSTHFQAEFGEKLKVVGSTPQLGEWDVGSAPDMHWTDGHVWVTEMALPKDVDFEFKVVHVSGSRVQWEASNNRRFTPTPDVAPTDADALAVNVVFNLPELTTIQPISMEEEGAVAASPEWFPTDLGLPEDITAGLTAAVEEQVAAASLPLVVDPITIDPQEVAEPEAAFIPLPDTGEPEPLLSETSGAVIESPTPDTFPAAAEQDTQEETAVAVEAGVEAAMEAERKLAVAETADDKSITPPAAKALGTAAMLGVAGLIATTLAVDITDAALMGVILTAGATLTGDKQGREDAKNAAKTALNVGLNVTENVARKFGLKSHAERRAEAEAEAEADVAAAKLKEAPQKVVTPEEDKVDA